MHAYLAVPGIKLSVKPHTVALLYRYTYVGQIKLRPPSLPRYPSLSRAGEGLSLDRAGI